MAPLKILITGVTGYIGGTVLNSILESAKNISKHSISVLIRGEKMVNEYRKLGVTPIVFQSLDETDLLRRIACEHDIVIHTASVSHSPGTKALILGLADRQKTGKAVHYIHTTGTSSIGDNPISGLYHESRIFSDKDNIFAYEKIREADAPYAQRTCDITAIETGLEAGVKVTLVMSPTIYGVGTGIVNKLSIQIPTIIRAGIRAGQVNVIGDGQGIWDYVHILDLGDLYVILLNRLLEGKDLPTGEHGILFSSTGRYSWLEGSQRSANALYELGAVKTKEVKSMTLEEAADLWGGGITSNFELGFASNSRTTSDVSFELGWKPTKTEDDFKNHFLEEAKILVAENH